MSRPQVRDGFVSTDNFPGVDCSKDPSMTDQSQAAECDVNQILDRFMKTGVLPGVDIARVYGDYSEPFDFHEAQNIIAHANEQFAALNAKVRHRFHNDPAEFLSFVADPENASEMVKLGLATIKDTQPPSQPLKTDSGASNSELKPASPVVEDRNPKSAKT